MSDQRPNRPPLRADAPSRQASPTDALDHIRGARSSVKEVSDNLEMQIREFDKLMEEINTLRNNSPVPQQVQETPGSSSPARGSTIGFSQIAGVAVNLLAVRLLGSELPLEIQIPLIQGLAAAVGYGYDYMVAKQAKK